MITIQDVGQWFSQNFGAAILVAVLLLLIFGKKVISMFRKKKELPQPPQPPIKVPQYFPPKDAEEELQEPTVTPHSARDILARSRNARQVERLESQKRDAEDYIARLNAAAQSIVEEEERVNSDYKKKLEDIEKRSKDIDTKFDMATTHLEQVTGMIAQMKKDLP